MLYLVFVSFYFKSVVNSSSVIGFECVVPVLQICAFVCPKVIQNDNHSCHFEKPQLYSIKCNKGRRMELGSRHYGRRVRNLHRRKTKTSEYAEGPLKGVVKETTKRMSRD